MAPTRIRLLAAVALVCAAFGWGVVQVVFARSGRLLPVPWLAPAALWLIAAAVAFWALSCRPRIQRRPGTQPLPAVVAARTAALALAASRIGAAAAGFYAGIAVAMAAFLGTQTGSSTFWAAVASVAGAGGLAAAGLWLEHVCRLPVGPPNPPGTLQ